MRDDIERKQDHDMRGMKLHRVGISVLVLALLLIGAFPVSAWLTKQRRIAAMAQIDNPIAIYIGAGERENMSYININNIDVTSGESNPTGDNEKYTDYVFSIYGNAVYSYMLQLAHTTNNPFRYEIYPAKTGTEGVTATTEGAVKYETHDEDGAPTGSFTFYAADYFLEENGTPTPIAGHYINQAGTYDFSNNPNVTQSEELMMADKTKHDVSYNDTETPEPHAEPLYWKTEDPIPVANEDYMDFTHYYILRVIWPETYNMNTRETDLICIVAKDTTAGE